MSSSSSKRRKLEGEPLPPSPASAVSAVSALAARRRLGVSAVQSQHSSPEPATPSTNSFSALQSPKPKRRTDGTQSPRVSAKQAFVRRKDANRPSAGCIDQAPQGASQALDVVALVTKSSVSSPQPHNISHSSFQVSDVKHRTIADGGLEVSLDEGERFIVLGCFGICVVAGEVTVAGATLRSSENILWVYATHCSAVPVIRTTQDSRLQFHNDTNSTHLRKLGRLSPLLRRLWNEPAESNHNKKRTFRFIRTSSDAPKRCAIQELVSPPDWNKLLASVTPTMSSGNEYSGFICGPKSAGKSTFARLLTNRLLTTSLGDSKAVMVLDLDPGQPEFAPPGTLSLIRVSRPNLGVPFTHTSFGDPGNTIVRCHALASVTPASSPDLFIACAIDLYEFYQRLYRKCPLIINTPGWILGTGLDLLVALITKLRPTQVIYMSEEGPTDVVETLQEATRHEFSTLPSQPSEVMSRTSAHFRSMQMMSYFHSQVLPVESRTAKKTSSIKWLAQPLSHTRPYVVQYEGNTQGILGILSYDCQTPPNLLADSINGAILAIVEIEASTAFREIDGTKILNGDGERGAGVEISRTPEGLPLIVNATDGTLDPRYCHTIGLALVRGIDAPNKSLQVVTPLPLSTFENIRSKGTSIVLVHGSFDTPSWAYTEDMYLQTNSDDTAMEKDLEMSEADSSEDDSEVVDSSTGQASRAYVGDVSTVPWIETLRGDQKRPVGSRVWRVRRDLGRNNGD
ncbi:hypothetical protein E4U57_002087 [Claviceps arundinis]|uniref:Polynucleotide 5'-hydroxyl-kinase GRC3 n=1 Tax=Claviceps arundinis TaxID=1623583 RepID=A0A9P7SP63_9HYPO|nr:hypothetical protein E4U57_002087 [Claviceps arundinis]KAG5963175.1 hypothetical protein E4U56_002847 [Claviceps arundinis]